MLIRGTFENGTEYTVIATALNLPKDLLRKIQKFDFTKKNPSSSTSTPQRRGSLWRTASSPRF